MGMGMGKCKRARILQSVPSWIICPCVVIIPSMKLVWRQMASATPSAMSFSSCVALVAPVGRRNEWARNAPWNSKESFVL